jgi:hypothetical protein
MKRPSGAWHGSHFQKDGGEWYAKSVSNLLARG